MVNLTLRQKQVLDFLIRFNDQMGYAPSYYEIGKGISCTSLATVHKHLSNLERKGFIRRRYNHSRSVEVIRLPRKARTQVRHEENERLGRLRACVKDLINRPGVTAQEADAAWKLLTEAIGA